MSGGGAPWAGRAGAGRGRRRVGGGAPRAGPARAPAGRHAPRRRRPRGAAEAWRRATAALRERVSREVLGAVRRWRRRQAAFHRCEVRRGSTGGCHRQDFSAALAERLHRARPHVPRNFHRATCEAVASMDGWGWRTREARRWCSRALQRALQDFSAVAHSPSPPPPLPRFALSLTFPRPAGRSRPAERDGQRGPAHPAGLRQPVRARAGPGRAGGLLPAAPRRPAPPPPRPAAPRRDRSEVGGGGSDATDQVTARLLLQEQEETELDAGRPAAPAAGRGPPARDLPAPAAIGRPALRRSRAHAEDAGGHGLEVAPGHLPAGGGAHLPAAAASA